MQVQVNGELMEVASGQTVRGLIEQLGLGRGPVAVERNGEVVPRIEHAAAELCDGDRVEVVHLVGGG